VKKSTIWLIVGIGAAVMFACVSCATFASFLPSSNSNINGAARADVDLEKLTSAFEKYVSAGTDDIKKFEATVNDKSKGIYKGKDKVTVDFNSTGAVVGYVDKNADSAFQKTGDEKVFELNVHNEKKQVVAQDRYNNYYAHRPSSSGFFTGLLIGNMLTRQRSYYGGGYWAPPRSANYVRSGYYNRSRGYSSRSTRSGSRSSYGRSRSGSGGFGSGK